MQPSPEPVRDVLHQVHLRPLHRGDEHTLQVVFEGMTDEQRAQRFHTGMPRLAPVVRRHLANVDGRTHVALVAVRDGVPVGVGRYHRIGPHQVELALEVAHAHTGKGVGGLLVEALLHRARTAGFAEAVVEILPANAAALRLAARHGFDLTTSGSPVHGVRQLTPLHSRRPRPAA